MTSPQSDAAREAEIISSIQHELDLGAANPTQAASEAVARGEFGLIGTGRFNVLPMGVTCFTPRGEAPRYLVRIRHGDFMPPETMRLFEYAAAYNRVVVE